MIIGFDFDKVFIDYPPLVPYSFIDLLYKGKSYFRKNISKDPTMHYRYPGDIEQKIRILSHYSFFRPPINENIKALKKISDEGKSKTYLVSSRFSFLRKRTDQILLKYNLSKYFDGIYFNYKNRQPHIFKETTIKKLKIDTYIDDDLQLSLYLSKKIPELTIYWVRDKRRKPEVLPKNVISISNLSELKKHLLKK